MKYVLTYTFDIEMSFDGADEYEQITKRFSMFIASLPDWVVDNHNAQFGRNIPPYNPNADKYLIAFTLTFRDYSFLQQGLQLLNAYCILHYIEPDEAPIISSLEA